MQYQIIVVAVVKNRVNVVRDGVIRPFERNDDVSDAGDDARAGVPVFSGRLTGCHAAVSTGLVFGERSRVSENSEVEDERHDARQDRDNEKDRRQHESQRRCDPDPMADRD